MTTPVILDEETYTEALSVIIQRDFFPHLSKFKAQQNYWEAQKSGTLADLERASRDLHRLSTGNTSISSRRLTSPSKKSWTHAIQPENLKQPLNYYHPDAEELEDKVNLDLSLDQFQTLYTSEDNASFTEILDRTNARRREKLKWLLDKERIAEEKLIEAPKVDDDGFVRPPDMWRYKAKNALMYAPEGTGKSLLNEKESRAEPRMIDHRNTNLPISAEPSPEDSKQKIAKSLQGNTTPWKKLSEELDDAGISESESVYHGGYRLVDATPSPNPSRIGTPMMTWGSIEGTPMLISGSETPGPQFSLPKVSRREELGMKLSEKASRAHRKRTAAKVAKGTPRPAGTLLTSPAAQHLLRRSNTPRTSAFGEALRSSYGHTTPSGSKTPGATPTPLFRAGITPTNSAFQSPLRKKK
ncbi:nuclear protein DGCR14 [Dichotomocladium elegans]|nr:nuclear protein DGCR14 [Dichotomocladium elegans]